MKPPYLIGLIITILFITVSCTVIAWNKGNVSTVDKDSHDAQGTNKAATYELNVSPR